MTTKKYFESGEHYAKYKEKIKECIKRKRDEKNKAKYEELKNKIIQEFLLSKNLQMINSLSI